VTAGDDVAASRITYGGCGTGIEASPGDDVLLVYAPRLEMPDGGELQEARVLVSPWQSRLVFGQQAGKLITVERAEVDGLIDQARCMELFPEPGSVDSDPGPACLGP
jgi:hypothetical protein